MTDASKFDIAIIGGGIIGCATAMTLASEYHRSVVVLEAAERLAAHQTGNNSGVIHSGLYYKPGSLKALNCTRGREQLYRFCEEHRIAHERCGKIVVATRQEELLALEELERRGIANGLEGLERLGPEEIREQEPQIAGIAGLRVPQTGIVDYVAVTQAYARLVKENGGSVYLNAKVKRCIREQGGLKLETEVGVISTKNLINCGGLQSDRVARICGVKPRLRIVPFRGEYYELISERKHLVKNLVYPVPDPRFPFLGVHFTRMIQGGVEAGPNAVLALAREGYSWGTVSIKDICSYLLYPGFWKMAAKYWWTGFGEVWRSLSKRAFVKALRRLLPGLKLADIRRSGAGVRAQALEPTGKLSDDFQIVQAPRMIHVLNAPSPAATASLSIARTIADIAEKSFEINA